MKKEKWSGVKIDPKRIKEYKRMKRAEILTEVVLFGVFALFLIALAAFLLEVTR